jgi:hypothetical protein
MLKINGIWFDVDLYNAMLIVEVDQKSSTTQFWGLFSTSLRNHLYNVALIMHRRKLGVRDNVKKVALVNYIKEMQRIGQIF